jgi:glutamate dehydrogenase
MPNPEARKSALIDQVADEVRQRVPADGTEDAEAFVRHFYTPVAPRDVVSRDAHYLAGSALSLWHFAAERPSGVARVRVYNPTLDQDAYNTEHTVLEVVNDDMPFLVDSVVGELNRRNRTVHLVIHPILPVERDAEGRRQRLGADGDQDREAESWIHIQFDQETDREVLADLEERIRAVLAQVRTVVEDWQAIRRRVTEVTETLGDAPPTVDYEDVADARRLLEWIDDHHFTFLGYREYELSEPGEDGRRTARVVPDSGLGLLRDTDGENFPLSPEELSGSGRNPLLQISKAGRRSPVHRPVHMDYVGVRRLDGDGQMTGGWSFLGLLTSGVYNASAGTIPYVSTKIREVMERAGLPAASHDAKALLHILETFPRDELFQMTEDELYETSLGILQLQDRQRLALFVREDSSERFVSCLVYVPRDRYNTDLRTAMAEILAEAFQGEISAFYTQVADSPLARAHFIIRTTPGKVPPYDVQEIEDRLAEAAQSWTDRLQQMLVLTRGEEQGLDLLERFGEAFPVAYREEFDAAAALYDIDQVEAAFETSGLRTSLYRPAEMSNDQMRFKIFHAGALRPLSDVLPMLENMGLKVVFEVPYEVTPADRDEVLWIRDLVLASGDGSKIEIDTIRELFQETFHRVWDGEVENDVFNRLVLQARLDWRQVVVLRAYARYLRQAGLGFSQTFIAETLASNPRVARLLLTLFETRFDPELQAQALGSEAAATVSWAQRETRSRELLSTIRRALNRVKRLDQDRVLRRFRNLVESTLRTNHFQTGPDGQPKPYLSLKLSSRKVQGLPAPRPLYEVFVYSPRTEAVHLRGGPVARGGIRWSDRPEDFRTEVLGLMKAQMVKNAVIVPVGAKGGFVVKRTQFASHEERAQEGRECYRTMIRGLLDLTDNLEGEQVVPPTDLVRWDGDDSYLVVAADKGTATFSDLANGIASEYGFWLGDAFASGGSAGYDHKKMGITARGAWESVKRHFREQGMDIQNEPFSVVGVGDMGGDVFGNGMLLSRQIRLVGAFNHMHIFIDPNPDPEVSFRERERLFRLPRSTWNDYDREALSPGGGVFDREAKSIPLSPEIQRLLGIERASLNPNELIRALLRAQVDLLWFGGIGTFVKAATESHAVTGDRQNDDLRVDAAELRCKVIGEGANLGITQRGRIEFALAGGHINTDFIDNSGGVDCSDHEVNIKIPLNEMLADSGGTEKMTLEERNRLLVAMTDEVAELVLRDNYLQAQAISVAEAGGELFLDRQIELIRSFERAGRLDRTLEDLPGDDVIELRRTAGQGLTRPEIAVLLAYSKIALYEELLASDLPEDPLLLRDLFQYFPEPLRESYRDAVGRHRLRREIIATFVTSSMVNRVGPTFVTRLAEETGRSGSDVARAYTIVREAFDLRQLWLEIEALDGRVPADLQIRLIHEVGRLVEWGTHWLLRTTRGSLDISAAVERLKPAVLELQQDLETLLPEADRLHLEERTSRGLAHGLPKDLARRLAALEFLGSAFDIARIARGREHDVEQVGLVFYHVGARFQLERLRAAAHDLAGESSWTKMAMDGLVENLFSYQCELTESVLEEADEDTAGAQALETWLTSRRHLSSRLDRQLTLLDQGSPEVAMLVVVDHQLRHLVES